MDIEQAKLFHRELIRVKASEDSGRVLSVIVGAGWLVYLIFPQENKLLGFYLITAMLLFCVYKWVSGRVTRMKYTKSLNSYCWASLRKSYEDAKHSELLD
ncbi:hypothetical protein [Pectobacterium brasiliense]|uniref:hypothetical protein n=1 Tax=Pectobacterium brasiliense TaxID=180957 RepID=UPI00300DD3E0